MRVKMLQKLQEMEFLFKVCPEERRCITLLLPNKPKHCLELGLLTVLAHVILLL